MQRFLVLLIGLAGISRAQDAGYVELRFTVTTVSGQSVYIDLGSDDHVAVGDRVRIELGADGTQEGIVRNVSRQSSRVALQTAVPVSPEVSGVVIVPESRLAAPAEPTPPAEAPSRTPVVEGERPPVPLEWAEPPSEWKSELPLLSAATRVEPHERPRSYSGSVFWDGGFTLDQDRQFATAATGVNMVVENPFRRGGRLVSDIELFTRSSDLQEGFDVTENELLIQRLFYTHEGTADSGQRWSVGRFLPLDIPEFGLIDGGEYVHKISDNASIGGTAGYLTGVRDAIRAGEDFQVSGFYRFDNALDGSVSGRAGFQKTFHQGRPDRDLFVGGVAWRGGNGLHVNSTVWVDWYGKEDNLKSSGAELTRLLLSGGYSQRAYGLIAYLSSARYPQLLRDDFASIEPDQISHERIDRLSLTGWVEPSDGLRFTLRTEGWQDRDSEGNGYELGFVQRDRLIKDGSFGASVFSHTQEFTNDIGLRLSASKRVGQAWWRAFYDLRSYDFETETGQNTGSLQHQLRVSHDRPLSERWSLSSFASILERDSDLSVSLGLTLRWSF